MYHRSGPVRAVTETGDPRMPTLVLLALVGLGAQLVDGSLGMAYGVTSTTLLLAIGTNPAAASATVHLAEIGTTIASGLSHWRFGNVDWRVVLRIGIPGAVGAFAGATFLSWISTELAKPLMALLLLGLGIYVLARFTFRGLRTDRLGQPLRSRFLTPLGLVAGFMDATGGGGWGPVGTPALLASGRMEPRRVVGSIDTSELLVSVAASLGFLVGLGTAGIDVTWVVALLLGGLVAAPGAAWLVRVVPPRVLGSAVGGIIVLTNVRTLLQADLLAVATGPHRRARPGRRHLGGCGGVLRARAPPHPRADGSARPGCGVRCRRRDSSPAAEGTRGQLVSETIRIGIAGYGNLGRGVEAALAQNADMTLVGVFTRRDPAQVRPQRPETQVLAWDTLATRTEDIDVLILCGGSKEDLPVQGPELAGMFHTVDSYDTHADRKSTRLNSSHVAISYAVFCLKK